MPVELIVAIIGGLASVVAGAMSALSHRGSLRSAPKRTLEPPDVGLAGKTGFPDAVEQRLQEVRQALKKYQTAATTHRVANSLLAFSQFVVGGLLASSFLQDTLSKQLVGALGLLVLFSSLVRQHYRPEVQFLGARKRAARLKSAIREAEDARFARIEGAADVPTDYEIRRRLSDELAAAESAEVDDLSTTFASPDATPDRSHAKKPRKQTTQ